MPLHFLLKSGYSAQVIYRPYRLARLGHVPLTDETGVQIPLRSPARKSSRNGSFFVARAGDLRASNGYCSRGDLKAGARRREVGVESFSSKKRLVTKSP